VDTNQEQEVSVNPQVLRVLNPPHVAMINQPHLQESIVLSHMVNPNPQYFIPSYVPPKVPQPRVHINVMSQAPSSQVVILTYANPQNPNPMQAYFGSKLKELTSTQ